MSKAKSNVCVNFDEAVFFVPTDRIYTYQKKSDPTVIKAACDIPFKELNDYDFMSDVSQAQYDMFRTALAAAICKACPSFESPDNLYLKKGKRVIAQNKVMQIVLEDNGWAIAVELLKKAKANEGIYKQTFANVLLNLRNALLAQFSDVYVRDGSYGATTITQADPYDKGNEVLQLAIDED